MTTGYRFGDARVGEVQSAFRSKADLRSFLSQDELEGTTDCYEVKGQLVDDTGGPDGLRIRVESVRATTL